MRILLAFLLVVIYSSLSEARIPNKHFLYHSHVNKSSDFKPKNDSTVTSKIDYIIYNPRTTTTRKMKTNKLNTTIPAHLKTIINNPNQLFPSSTLMTKIKNKNQRKRVNSTAVAIKKENFNEMNKGRFMGFLFNDTDDFFIKQSMLTNFLSKSKYFLSKLEKEAEIVETDFRFYGKKYYHLLRSKLKSAYEEMRRYLCNAFEFDHGPADSMIGVEPFDEDDFDDDDKKRRRQARYSEKRLFKKICSK
jgi:hypothetical protein